jgi:tRNA(Ile)-lysidine synthase
MQNRFLLALAQQGVDPGTGTVLVAASGGMDSMVLASLLQQNGYSLAVAHCNYQLRGADSDADEELVRNWCEDRSVPFHSKRVNAKELAEQSGQSVQMIARNERYQFFSELMESYDYQVTAVAHHANDQVESLLINILRGTGIRGFRGMPASRDGVIRPLLGFTKDEIQNYAVQHNVSFREDVSNQETYYLRNWVRLKLLPMLQARDNNAFRTLVDFCNRVEVALPNYEAWVQKKMHLVKTENGISIEQLKKSKAPFTILKEILEPLGFNTDMVFEVLDILESDSGATVSSASHQVLKDRDELIISSLDGKIRKPKLKFESLSRGSLESLKVHSSIALLDAEKIDIEELELRKWQQGDKFKPLGMKGWKLLSDFFIDEKVSLLEKQQVWLLTHQNEIVWVIGHRIDDRFKVTDNTQKVLKVTLQG